MITCNQNLEKQENYMDTVCFIFFRKTEDIYIDIGKDVKTKFDTSNYDFKRPQPRGKNEKVIKLMKNELVVNIMTEFAALRPKRCSYLTYDNDENKKTKGAEK